MLEENELIKACLKKDAKAERQLWNLFAPRMMGLCYRYTSSQAEADDMLQESFIRIFMNLRKFNHGSSLETWITRITINTCLTYLRLNKKFTIETDIGYVQDDSRFSTLQFHQIDAKILMDCIQKLPDLYRTILNLYAIDGYTHKEIAEQLHITEGHSRINCFRAKNLLEKKLAGLNIKVKQNGTK